MNVYTNAEIPKKIHNTIVVTRRIPKSTRRFHKQPGLRVLRGRGELSVVHRVVVYVWCSRCQATLIDDASDALEDPSLRYHVTTLEL